MESLIGCLDEISLDGLDGCPIVQLWKHLEERIPEFPLRLDDAAKRFLWKGIVNTLDIEFFVLPEPLPHIFNSKCDEPSKNEKDDKKPKNPLDEFQGALKDSNTFQLVRDYEAGVRGSCPTFAVRENVTMEIRGQHCKESMTLEASYERWGDRLVMVASQELREKAIFGLTFDPNAFLSDLQYCLLEHVGQARYKGRMQRSISTSYMKIEPGTTFHHLKGLKRMGLVSSQSVVLTTCDANQQNRNYQTNVVRLRRFHVQQFHKYDLIASRLSKMLLSAPNQQLPLTDVIKSFSEIRPAVLRKIRNFLQQAGYLAEQPLVSVKEDVEDHSPAKRKKKGKSEAPTGTMKGLVVRLLKPFVLKTDSIMYDDDDDDEDEVDEDHDQLSDDIYSNTIAERPFMKQMYDFVENGGPQGFTLTKLRRATNLPFLDVRLVMKHLTKGKKVHELHQHIGKTRVSWFVASPYAESNIQAMKMKQERAKLKEMESKAAASSAGVTPRMSPTASPCPSPAPCTPAEEDSGEKKPKKVKSLLGEKVTYRSLKRKTVVIEYLQKVKVVDGVAPLLKTVISSEEEEGHDGRIDRKVLLRLLDDLISQGMIRKLKTVVHSRNASQMVELYLHSSTANDDSAVSFSLEQCRLRLQEQSSKLAEKRGREKEKVGEKEKKKIEKATAKEEEKKKKQKEKEEKDKKQRKKDSPSGTDVEEEAEKPTRAEQQKVLADKYCFLPKFPRLQLIHELIWRLVHDRDAHDQTSGTSAVPESGTSESSPTADDHARRVSVGSEMLKQTSSVSYNTQGNPCEDGDWLNHLEPLQKCYNEEKEPTPWWFRMSDVLLVMPVFILSQAMIITEEIEELDFYVLDPVRKFTPLRYLPYELKKTLTGKSRFKSIVKELMCFLSQLGLITPSLPIPPNHNNTRIYLNKGVKLLDTTSSLPNYQTICAPPGTQFQSRTHFFTSMEAVRNFWSDLKCVSLNTPLGVVRTDEGSTHADRTPLSILNKYRRLVQFAHEQVEEGRIELPPGDHLGAAGLDRSLFSHLKRNWTRVMDAPFLKTASAKEKRVLPTTTTIRAAEHESSTPAVRGSTHHDTSRTIVSVGVAETKKQAKKGSKEQKKQKLKRKLEDKDAGKSVAKKNRLETTVKQGSTATAKQKQEKEKHFLNKGHVNAVDEEDRNVLARKAGERISFSAEEDSWLLLFRIALGVMKNETTRFYPFVCMRNILHKTVSSSLDKTAPNLQRRICKLMKTPHSQLTVKICLAECAQDQTFQGFDDPKLSFEETFPEVVKRLRQKFSSSSFSIGGDFMLVSSLEELYDKFEAQTIGSKKNCLSDQRITSLGPDISSVSDINKAAIRDQIQIAFTTPQQKYDAFRVFQMFNNYTKEELEDVFKDMLKKNLVSRRVSLEVTIPDEILNMDPSELSQPKPAENDAKADGGQRPSRPPAKNSGSKAGLQDCENSEGGESESVSEAPGTTLSSATPNHPEKSKEIHGLSQTKRKHIERGDPKPPVSPSTPRKRAEKNKVGSSSVRSSSLTKTKSGKSCVGAASTKTKKLEKREVFTLKFPLSTVCKFTSSSNLKSVKESCRFLDSHTETREVSSDGSQRNTQSTIPVASLSYGSSTSSRSSRTALMLARGGKDPYVSIQQLPARALNTHDFMSLRPCVISLTLKESVGEVSVQETVGEASNLCKRESRTRFQLSAAGCPQSGSDVDNDLSPRPVADERDSSDETNTPSEKGRKMAQCHGCITAPVVVCTDVSIENYIEHSKTHFSFKEGDISLARIIHDIVAEGKELGVKVNSLKERIDKIQYSGQYSFEEHVKYMCNYRLLYRVGVYEPSLVTGSFVHPWSVVILKPTKGDQHKDEEAESKQEDASNAASLDLEGTGPVETKTSPQQKETDCAEFHPSAASERGSTTIQTSQTGFTGAQSANKDTANSETDGAAEENSISKPTTADNQTEVSSQTSSQEKPESSKETKGQAGNKLEHRYKGKNYEKYSVVCRPWITIDGTTSLELLRMFSEMVLMLILEKPGIPERFEDQRTELRTKAQVEKVTDTRGDIAKHFFEALRPVALKDILESLMLEGCIEKHVRTLPPRMSLFSKPKPTAPCETLTFYTPAVDCILKQATSKISGYT